jgi:hypothetical protein
MSSPELTNDSLEAADVYPIYAEYIRLLQDTDFLPRRDLMTEKYFTTRFWNDLLPETRTGYLERFRKGIEEAKDVHDDPERSYRLYVQSQEIRRQVDEILTVMDETTYAQGWADFSFDQRRNHVRTYRSIINGTSVEGGAADIIKQHLQRRGESAAN